MTDREKRVAEALRKFLANPTDRTIEENAPLLKLKNGRRLMIEPRFRHGEEGYQVSRDFGCTCREIAFCRMFSDLVRLVIEEGDAAA